MQYFTALGLDTGYDIDYALGSPDTISHAGLERRLSDTFLPEFIKSPWISDDLEMYPDFPIELAIVPVRNLFDAAEARRRVFSEAQAAGKNPLSHPGSLWKTGDFKYQESLLALQFFKLIHGLSLNGCNIIFLNFPNFVFDHGVLFSGLECVLKKRNITYGKSEAAFDLISDPSKIHSFKSSD
jgi:hypothetical protein